MRLDPAEIASLPMAAALVDRARTVIAQTPEWRGATPGAVCYHAGQGQLMVGRSTPAWPEQEAVMRRLLTEVRAAASAMTGPQAVCTEILGSSLELVAGWPPEDDSFDTIASVLERAVTAIRARVPEVEIEVENSALQPVQAPNQIALVLLQFAANACRHGGRTKLRMRAGPGPTFYVEWPATAAGEAVAGGQSHSTLRRGWGLGYVRMVADYLGGTALPPGPPIDGWAGPCLSLGNRRLTLPLALYAGRRTLRSNQAWEQGLRSRDPSVPAAIQADLDIVLAAAEARPGALARHGLLSGRRTPSGTWMAMPPEAGKERVRDVLRGLDHERALWSAPEPHSTRVHGLLTVLGRSLGDAPAAFAPEAFARELPRACAGLGVAAPELGPILACPDPRLTAFLIAELGGRLVAEASGTFLQPGPAAASSPLLSLLGPNAARRVRLTPGGD